MPLRCTPEPLYQVTDALDLFRGSTERSHQRFKQRQFGIEENSISADPLFVDVDNGDLGFQKRSPALELGIEPIDLEKVGLIERR